jgi:hypothetical protein
MAVNTAKTKFIIFHTRGRNLNPGGKTLFFYNNPSDTVPDPELISPLECIHSTHPNPESTISSLVSS